MNLVIQKIGDKQYVSIRESYWDPARRKYSSRTIKNYGRLDLLQKENPNILEELKVQVQQHKQSYKSEKQKVLKERVDSIKKATPVSKSLYDSNPGIQIGACVYRQIWNRLNLHRKLKDIQLLNEADFDFPAAVFFLTVCRNLLPGSKYAQWRKHGAFPYGIDSLDLNHFYRSMDMLVPHKQELLTYLNGQIDKKYHRAFPVALYDVSTYFFESQDPDTLRWYGFSKDNKFNQMQIVMGLLIDDHGIPVDYEIFPGSPSEFDTMLPYLEKLRDVFGIRKVIARADWGSDSEKNLLKLRELGIVCEIFNSDSGVSPEKVKEISRGHRQIEELFSIPELLPEERQGMMWTLPKIQAHFLISFMAIVVQRILEVELARAKIKLSAEEIVEALREAILVMVSLSDAETIFCKYGVNQNFDAISEAVGLYRLHSIALPAEVRSALGFEPF